MSENKTARCCGPVAGCCEPAAACCGTQAEANARKTVTIDFLYLDLSVCDRCQGTEQVLAAAVADVAGVLEAAGMEVQVNKIHVTSEAQAAELGFVSSPTIRVNGRDIQMEVKESRCEACGDLCGDEVDCRVWVYRGEEYSVPPQAMVVDAILKTVYGGEPAAAEGVRRPVEVPENLKRYFAKTAAKNAAKQPESKPCDCGGRRCC